MIIYAGKKLFLVYGNNTGEELLFGGDACGIMDCFKMDR